MIKHTNVGEIKRIKKLHNQFDYKGKEYVPAIDKLALHASSSNSDEHHQLPIGPILGFLLGIASSVTSHIRINSANTELLDLLIQAITALIQMVKFSNIKINTPEQRNMVVSCINVA